METFLKKIDGYKTGTGIAILYIVGLVVAFYHGAGWQMPDWLMGLQEAAAYTGASLGIVGLGDKIRKGQISLPSGELDKLDQAVSELQKTIDDIPITVARWDIEKKSLEGDSNEPRTP